MKKYIILNLLLLLSMYSYGQDFVYTPKNPAFGGDTFNYNWLLSSAQAQDTYEDPNAATSSSQNALDDFEETLNRQILYQLSQQLITKQFGTQGLQAGSYEIGSYKIDITEGAEGVTVTIVDVSTGSQTTVLVPSF